MKAQTSASKSPWGQTYQTSGSSFGATEVFAARAAPRTSNPFDVEVERINAQISTEDWFEITPILQQHDESEPHKKERNPMTGEITQKEYTDLKSELALAKANTQAGQILVEMKEIRSIIDTRMAAVDAKLLILETSANNAKVAAEKAEAAANTTKWNILAASVGIAGVIAALWGLWGSAVQTTLGVVSQVTSVQSVDRPD